jgi:putative transposase
VWADRKYHNHELYGWLAEYAHYHLEVVRRPEGAQGFVPLPKRWAVERTFAWLGRCRRPSVDRERTTLSCEAMIHLAMIHLMLNRLRPTGEEKEFRYRAVG